MVEFALVNARGIEEKPSECRDESVMPIPSRNALILLLFKFAAAARLRRPVGLISGMKAYGCDLNHREVPLR